MKGTLMVLAALASQVLALPQNQGGGAEIKPKEPPPLSLVAHSTDTSKQKLELSFILYMGPEIASADVGYCEMAGANNKKSIESVQVISRCSSFDASSSSYAVFDRQIAPTPINAQYPTRFRFKTIRTPATLMWLSPIQETGNLFTFTYVVSCCVELTLAFVQRYQQSKRCSKESAGTTTCERRLDLSPERGGLPATVHERSRKS